MVVKCAPVAGHSTRSKPKPRAVRVDEEVAAIRKYFSLGGASNWHAIALASTGHCNPQTLRRRVQGHADVESALAALAGVRSVGRPSDVPRQIEAAVARVAVEMFQCNHSLHRDELAVILYGTARDHGVVFKVQH